MNPPQVYMCSPSWTLLPPPSHTIPLGRPSALFLRILAWNVSYCLYRWLTLGIQTELFDYNSISQSFPINIGLLHSFVNFLNCLYLCSVQFSSVTQSCPTLCDPMKCSTPGLPVHHQLQELTQTHVHPVSDAIQPSHPLSPPSPPTPNPS